MPSPEEVFRMLMTMNQSLTMLLADQQFIWVRLNDITRGYPVELVREAAPAPPSIHNDIPPPLEHQPLRGQA